MYKLRENTQGGEAPYPTTVEIERTEDRISFLFECEDSTLESAYDTDNADLWEGNVCEVFIRSRSMDRYYEIEVAPNGARFFALVTNDDGALTFDFREDFPDTSVEHTDNGYRVRISFDLVRYGMHGEDLFYNAYRIECRDGTQHLMALNPTMNPRFHIPSSFMRI